jgi:prepilin-type N-terminal cleavage/methylation domain-containing protein/prepilin-type processing-associated H-X9-DG protein
MPADQCPTSLHERAPVSDAVARTSSRARARSLAAATLSAPLRCRGFSLIELVITMLIMAILVALLIPTLNVVRTAALSAKCMGNLRQIDQVALMWGEEHQEYLMPLSWSVTRDYVDEHSTHADFNNTVRAWGIIDSALNCPAYKGPPTISDASASYGINRRLGTAQGPGSDGQITSDFTWGWNDCYFWKAANTKMTAVRSPSEKIYFMDSLMYCVDYVNPFFRRPHRGKANIAWMDGHCSSEPADFATAFPSGTYFDKP